MQVIVDEPGHNYYVPLFFMIGITLAFFGIVLMVLRTSSSQPKVENWKKGRGQVSEDTPLLTKSPRIASIDVFRGMTLCLMIFANYGAGQYWAALVHATWDGITLSDFAFPL